MGMKTVDELIADADLHLGADSPHSGNASLLAIAQMLKATLDRNIEIDRQQERYDAQDELLGRLGDSLRQLAADVHGTPTAVRLHTILEQEGL